MNWTSLHGNTYIIVAYLSKTVSWHWYNTIELSSTLDCKAQPFKTVEYFQKQKWMH